MEPLKKIAAAFQCPGKFLDATPYGSGHINDTYQMVFNEEGREVRYILQRVNHNIFKNVPGLMDNISAVTRHQRKKFEAAGAGDLDRRVLTLVPTMDEQDFHRDEEGSD